MDLHLDGLLESEQRGGRTKCSGTMDNLLIDKIRMMVCQHSWSAKRDMSMAWIDV